jgi:hypothetical protein
VTLFGLTVGLGRPPPSSGPGEPGEGGDGAANSFGLTRLIFVLVFRHRQAPRLVGGRTWESSWPMVSSTVTPENSASASSSSR